PASLARYIEATAVMPGGNTRTVLHYDPFPIAVANAEGCRLRDLDGAEYIDFLANTPPGSMATPTLSSVTRWTGRCTPASITAPTICRRPGSPGPSASVSV
ncbi:MAG: hypothetical protein M3Y41_07860, partial [Pseudomonadota bacterium]|nr:hypothetical protein [Pseudomonadota bacterium]